MQINLPQEVMDIITRRLDSGQYHSPTEVIVQALWLLDGWHDTDAQKLEKLRQAVQEGIDSGPSDLDPQQFFAQWRAELAARHAAANTSPI